MRPAETRRAIAAPRRSGESVTRQVLAVRRAGISAAVLTVAVLVGAVDGGGRDAEQDRAAGDHRAAGGPGRLRQPAQHLPHLHQGPGRRGAAVRQGVAGGCAATAGGAGRLRRPAVHPEQQRGAVRSDRPGDSRQRHRASQRAWTFGSSTTPVSSCRSGGDRGTGLRRTAHDQAHRGSPLFRGGRDRPDARRLASR